MLKTRLLTALLLIPIIIVITLWAPVWLFALFTIIITLMAAWEWSILIGLRRRLLRGLYVIAVLLGVLLANRLSFMVLLIIANLIILWALCAIVSYQWYDQTLAWRKPVLKSLFGFFLLITFWHVLFALKTTDLFTVDSLLYVIIIVWAADTAAYFAGRIWGRHALIPKVSPKKTWEGLAGGLVFGLLVAIVGSYWLPIEIAFWQLWLSAFCVIIAAMIGDLMISLLKRLRGVKDTGHLLPGHGGILDRIDSLIASIVVYGLCLMLVQI